MKKPQLAFILIGPHRQGFKLKIQDISVYHLGVPTLKDLLSVRRRYGMDDMSGHRRLRDQPLTLGYYLIRFFIGCKTFLSSRMLRNGRRAPRGSCDPWSSR